MQVALDELGFSPCFHARFMPYITDLFDALYDYAIGRRPDFPARHLFRPFNSAVDIPAPVIPLVMEAYPDAKVGSGSLSCVCMLESHTIRVAADHRHEALKMNHQQKVKLEGLSRHSNLVRTMPLPCHMHHL